MSQFDKLTLEVISRESIPEAERLGLAELQLQRARRMHYLMYGDIDPHQSPQSENTTTVLQLEALRDESLHKLQDEQVRASLEEGGENISNDGGNSDIQEKVQHTQADIHERTPTPSVTPKEATTPVEKNVDPAPTSASS